MPVIPSRTGEVEQFDSGEPTAQRGNLQGNQVRARAEDNPHAIDRIIDLIIAMPVHDQMDVCGEMITLYRELRSNHLDDIANDPLVIQGVMSAYNETRRYGEIITLYRELRDNHLDDIINNLTIIHEVKNAYREAILAHNKNNDYTTTIALYRELRDNHLDDVVKSNLDVIKALTNSYCEAMNAHNSECDYDSIIALYQELRDNHQDYTAGDPYVIDQVMRAYNKNHDYDSTIRLYEDYPYIKSHSRAAAAIRNVMFAYARRGQEGDHDRMIELRNLFKSRTGKQIEIPHAIGAHVEHSARIKTSGPTIL